MTWLLKTWILKKIPDSFSELFLRLAKHSRTHLSMLEKNSSFLSWISSGSTSGSNPPCSFSQGNRPHSHCNMLYPKVSKSLRRECTENRKNLTLKMIYELFKNIILFRGKLTSVMSITRGELQCPFVCSTLVVNERLVGSLRCAKTIREPVIY